MAVGIDDLLRAVFLGHVGEAIAALQDVGGRVVGGHYEAGIAVMPLIMLFDRQMAYEVSLECVSKCREMQFRVDLPAFQGDFPQA